MASAAAASRFDSMSSARRHFRRRQAPSPDNSKKRLGKHLLGLSGYGFEKILEEKHAIHVRNFHQEKSFQDLFEWV